MLLAADGASIAKTLVLLSWAAALLVLLQMAVAWIRSVRLGRKFSTRALIVGFVALLTLPVLTAMEPPSGFNGRSSILSAAFVFAIEIALALPSIGLAAYLNMFHREQISAAA